MTNKVKPIPEGYHTITPMILAKEASKLIDFIMRAFDGKQMNRHDDAEGKVMHALVRVGDSNVMLAEATTKYPSVPVVFYLYVNDVDATYKQAIEAGGKSLREPTTEFYGDRSAGVADDFGNQWWLATHVEDVSDEEIKRRQKELYPS